MNSRVKLSARRISAGIAGVLMLVFVLFSVFFIAHEAHHDCTGEDCPVCAASRLCERILCCAGTRGAAWISLLPVLFVLLAAPPALYGLARITPISVKVRMNN